MPKQLPSSSFAGRRARGPSVQAVLVAFITLVVLLLWLNFVQTQEIESTGREIQVRSEELRALDRQNHAVLREISEAGSEHNLAQRAKALGYRPESPIYLAIDEPIVGTANNSSELGDFLTSLTAEERQAQQTDPLWDLLDRQFGWSKEDLAP